ncbi:MAG: heat-inducible transcription repressor HrcA [Clostridiales bacterium]|nr:heat-inducible transcription repressor HrcA [Clostridiales bacterium]
MENKLIVGGDLSQRKKLILRSVIESHITTGEPIGSKYLMTKSDIPYSSATIRNEMAELEDMGYLEQPHTSAGRVPTSLGYRFYVDALMESYKLTATEIVSLNNIIKNKMGELDSILKSASKLIASMTNYTTVAVKAPHTDALTVSQFSYMLLEPTAFLLVMRMSDGNVETRHIRTEIPVDEEMLSKLSDVLGDNFCGVTSNAITLPMIMKAETEMGSAGTIIALAIKALYDTIGKPDEADINFEGINRLLEYPEFSDVEQMKKVISMFENKDDLMKIIESADDDKVNIFIGQDGELVDNSAFVFKTIKVGGKPVGAIGVFGPSRMDYSKVISTVEYLSKNLSGESAAGFLGEPEDEE